MFCFHCGETDTHVTDGNGLCYLCAFDHPEGSDAPVFYCAQCGGTLHIGACVRCQVLVNTITCTCQAVQASSANTQRDDQTVSLEERVNLRLQQLGSALSTLRSQHGVREDIDFGKVCHLLHGHLVALIQAVLSEEIPEYERMMVLFDLARSAKNAVNRVENRYPYLLTQTTTSDTNDSEQSN